MAFAKARLTNATNALESFQDRYGQLDPLSEQSATTGFITGLESRLVDLKVEEASLRRQFRDPNAPEVAFVADQVRELERQIQEERQKAVGAGGRDSTNWPVRPHVCRAMLISYGITEFGYARLTTAEWKASVN